jgi:hypothetical protein
MRRLITRSRTLVPVAVLAVVACVVVLTAQALPASADDSTPTVSPTHGPPGTSVTASASDWTGCSSMSVSGWGTTLGTAAINSTGAFSLTFKVPSNAPTGAAQLMFSPTCTHSTVAPFVTFTVDPPGTGMSAPAAPSNLTATAVDQHDIRLNWQDNSTNETGFEINNGVVSRNAGPGSTTYTWGGLAPGTYMCFKIRAYNSAGDSAWDPDISPYYVCTTTPKPAGPSPPAAPSNLTAVAVSPTSVRLTWTNNAANQSGVVISRNGVVSVDVQGATVSRYTWTGLSPGTKYWFYVASKIYGTPGDPTGSGNTQSKWVGPVYVTTASKPAPPVVPIYNDHYSGYVTPPGQYTAVGAVWDVPRLNCLRTYPFPYVLGPAGAHQWVGLGGVSGGKDYNIEATPLVQTGIISECKGGFQSNEGFWEVVPGNLAQPFNKKVEPGDQVVASVSYLGGGKYEMNMADLSKTHGWTAHAKYTVADTREGTTAEWIIEPGQPKYQYPGFPYYPLADFGKVTFSDASYSTDAHNGIILGGTNSVTPIKFIQGTPRNPAVSVSPVNPAGEFDLSYLTKRHIK